MIWPTGWVTGEPFMREDVPHLSPVGGFDLMKSDVPHLFPKTGILDPSGLPVTPMGGVCRDAGRPITSGPRSHLMGGTAEFVLLCLGGGGVCTATQLGTGF